MNKDGELTIWNTPSTIRRAEKIINEARKELEKNRMKPGRSQKQKDWILAQKKKFDAVRKRDIDKDRYWDMQHFEEEARYRRDFERVQAKQYVDEHIGVMDE